MADINLIKKLREMTGSGILDSKKALEASDNDLDKAVEWLRVNGIAKASKKASRVAAEGIVISKQNDAKIALLEVNSETDFVASNDKFLNAVTKIMDSAIESDVKTQADLLNLKVGDQTANELITNLTATIGEKISLRRFVAFDTKDVKAVFYVHSNKRIGTILISSNLDDDETLLKDVAMHITALGPKFAYLDDIDKEYIEKEQEIITKEYSEKYADKPKQVLENIVKGALNKQLAEITLMEQTFVKDSSKKIKELFPNSKLKFVRYEVGEGIEKEVVDFAKEVMSQVNNNK